MAGDRTERLLNLVIALLATSSPLPRATIRASIPGYDGNDVAFERKFERDKDELRSMGIPVETISDSSGEVLGYRIRREEYALPDLHLTAAERAAVAVAAAAWREAVGAPLAGTALLKLQAQDPAVPSATDPMLTLTVRDGALVPLLSAVRRRQVVSFEYRRPADPASSVRTVSPWGLRVSQGAWYLVGYDHDREAARTFRLSRIDGEVSIVAAERIAPPAGFTLEQATRDDAGATVMLQVTGEGAATLRRRGRMNDDGELLLDDEGAEPLLSLICAAGDSVVVREPAEVVQQVTAALDAILSAHEGGVS